MKELFLDRLQFLMQREGIKTQYFLAKTLEIRLTVVNGWFVGKVKCPGDKHLNRIAEYFHVLPAWLRYGDEKYEPKLSDRVKRLAESINEYVLQYPGELDKIEQFCNIWLGRPPAIDTTIREKRKRKA